MEFLAEYNIMVSPKRGCRGGAHKQRKIAPIVGNGHALLFLEATGENLMNNKQCANKQRKLCTMTMCLINAQSVRNKVPQLTEYIIEHRFYIVAIRETWLHNTSEKAMSTVVSSAD